MYKIVSMALIAMLVFLANAVHAEDNSKWCGTITAIYGVCSPELISNYLAKSSYSIPRVVPPKPLATTIVSTYIPPIAEQVKPVVAKERLYTPRCWYYTPQGWKFCRMVG